MINIDKLIQDAMRESHTLKLNLFRSVKAKLITMEKDKNRKGKPLTEKDIFAAMKMEYKELKESLDFAMQANESAKSKAFAAQLSYLDVYLPTDLSEMQTELLVQEAYLKEGNNMGMIMKYLKGTGKSINMRFASEYAKTLIKNE